MRTLAFVPFSEAVFIAGLSDRQMNRVVDERLVPAALFEQHGQTRRFARLAAAFACFYFDTESMLVATARRDIVEVLFHRVLRLPACDQVISLTSLPADVDWKVDRHAVGVDVSRYIAQAFARARAVDEAEALVNEDPEIMGGLPCFAGTRVPVGIVLESLADGWRFEDIRDAYPFITEAHVAAARVYAEVHPRRGRPRRMRDMGASPRETIKITG